MSRSVHIVYSGSGPYSEPLHVATTEKDAKTWAFDNATDGVKMNIKEFPIGGNGKPRAPKPEPAATKAE